MPKIPENMAKAPEVLGVSALADGEIQPFWSAPSGEVRLYHGHVMNVLARLPARSVHCCVTSPPYYSLRDYGTATWKGGDAGCDHTTARSRGVDIKPGDKQGTMGGTRPNLQKECSRCGARRVDDQLGGEELHDCLGWATGARCRACYVCRMVEVFRGVRRVLRDDGTLWLNLGDSYNGGPPGGHTDKQASNAGSAGARRQTIPLAAGNLVGIPWRVALAMQADGWVLRAAMPWVKPNAMPESCTNRPGKAVEDVFMFSKGNDYYFDIFAVRQVGKCEYTSASFLPDSDKDLVSGGDPRLATNGPRSNRSTAVQSGRSYRSCDLWYSSVGKTGAVGVRDDLVAFDVPVASFKGAHFATFSPRLIEPMILAGTSEGGCCTECAAPLRRVMNKTGGEVGEPDECGRDRSLPSNRNGITGSLSSSNVQCVETVGWKTTCGCGAKETVPCTVLDPFVGSGTTPATAVLLGRRGVGIDLSEVYLKEHAVPRCEAALIGEKKVAKKQVPIMDDAPPPVIARRFGRADASQEP